MKKLLIVLCSLLLLVAAVAAVLVWNGQLSFVHPLKTPQDGQIRVACVGDSVTYGFGIGNRGKYNYPAQLQQLLGDSYCVNNYGYSGRTVSDSGDRPYRAEKLYRKLLSFQPQIIILMLGSNDSKPFNWDPEAVRKSYNALLDDLSALESAPQIWVVTPTPVFPVNGTVKYHIDGDVIHKELVPMTLGIATGRGLKILDMHTVFAGRKDLFSDGCHPNRDGAKLFAETVFASIQSTVDRRQSTVNSSADQ